MIACFDSAITKEVSVELPITKEVEFDSSKIVEFSVESKIDTEC